MNDFDMKYMEPFERWKSSNFELLPFMSFRYLLNPTSDKNKIKEDLNRRKDTHKSITENLQNFKISLQAKLHNYQVDVAIELRGFPKPDLYFDDKKDNLDVRKILYISQKLQKMIQKYSNGYIEFLTQKLNYADDILVFLKKIVPPQCVISVFPEFFSLSYENNIIEKFYQLRNLRQRLFEHLSNRPKPVWISSFATFFSNLIKEANKFTDPELFYFEPIESEISLSRYLFVAHGREGRAIDKFIAQLSSLKFSTFPDRIVDFCMALIPRDLIVSNQDQSTAILLLYRALMDRIYTTQTTYFKQSTDYKRYWEFSYHKIIEFTIPPNMLRITDQNQSIRDAFLSDEIYREASVNITSSIFHSCTIDTLFSIHIGMVLIHKAAIKNIVNREPKEEDLKQLLSFDDLFSLLLGTILASDIPDIEQIQRVLKTFVPRSCLSPQLEYANANLEAILLHLKKF